MSNTRKDMQVYPSRIGINQRGVALITALLVVSLATIMAVSLMSRQFIDIRRTGNMMHSDQAYLDAIAAETFVGQLLASVRRQGQSTFDDLALFDLALMQLSGDMSDDSRVVSVQVSYPESRFNVNTLMTDEGKVNPKQENVYRRLLSAVLADLGENTSQVDNLVSSLLDWLDADEEARIDGAEDSVYEGKDVPYKAANRMLTSISELRLVDGYTETLLEGIPANEAENIEAVDGLLAYVDALPYEYSTINVNAVVKRNIITALSAYLEPGMVDDLMEGAPYEKITEFTGHGTLESIKTSDPSRYQKLTNEIRGYQSNLTVQSNYFLIKSQVVVGKTAVNLNSLVYVDKNGANFNVISRSIGTEGI
ncbi:MAG TPA: general secretion pathway protein GspK [Gammaproteobacteria bacterium]|nr:general secretion pathway protein GspK [Gammaproteobacteria bacterium]